jgi:hypothetical protein
MTVFTKLRMDEKAKNSTRNCRITKKNKTKLMYNFLKT